MDILKIATAGSVDDGKSTLIGRLLYDTRSITSDKLEAVAATSKKKGLNFTDLSLLTDGLIAEREQGITIDVAHIYFSTLNRKYIIADTPGHIEYTRNMITGASSSDTSIVLIDARNGVVEQTKRHLFISSLLKLTTVIIAINKMDLVNYSKEIFDRIESEIKELSEKIQLNANLLFVPISAKEGENVVTVSRKMDWYEGESLLEILEKLPVHTRDEGLPARLSVQYVIRPHSENFHDFRAYAGMLRTGQLSEGDEVVILPGSRRSRIKSIYRGADRLGKVNAGASISVELDDDVDVSRGNMIATAEAPPQQLQFFKATICWMEEQKLSAGKTFLLQHGTAVVKAKILTLDTVMDMHTMNENNSPEKFKLNDIGKASVKTSKPVFADIYSENPQNGAFILIDEFSNNTVAVGMVESA